MADDSEPPGVVGRFANALALLQKLLTSAAIVFVLFAVAVVFVSEMRNPPIVVEDFRVPEALADQGITGEVLAQHFSDELRDIVAEVSSARRQAAVLTPSFQHDVVAPGTGLSLQNLISTVRAAFGWRQVRISGELICAEPACEKNVINARVRVLHATGLDGRKAPVTIRSGQADLRVAALTAMELYDPYLAALYHMELSNPERDNQTALRLPGVLPSRHPDAISARELAMGMLGRDHPDSAWAANLLGNLEARDLAYDAAIDWYDRAQDFARSHRHTRFEVAHLNRGSIHLERMDFTAAWAEFDRAREINGKSEGAYLGLAMALLAQAGEEPSASDYAKAEALLKKQEAYAPQSTETIHQLTHLYLSTERYRSAQRYVLRARQVAPRDAQTHFMEAAVYHRAGNPDRDVARATRAISAAVAARPDFGPALHLFGDIELSRARYGDAIDRYAAAAEQGQPIEKLRNNLQAAVFGAIAESADKDRCAINTAALGQFPTLWEEIEPEYGPALQYLKDNCP